MSTLQLVPFADAIEALHLGKRIAREGWNGKGLFVFKQVPAKIEMNIVEVMQSLPNNVKIEFKKRWMDLGGSRAEGVDTIYFNTITYENQLALVYPNNVIYGYTPSTSDVLAEDWTILDLPTEEEVIESFLPVTEPINIFGDAIKALKAGKKVTREGWNGADMYLYLVPGQEFKSLTPHAIETFGEMTPYRQYLALKTAQGDVATWSPSNSDVLSDDWIIL